MLEYFNEKIEIVSWVCGQKEIYIFWNFDLTDFGYTYASEASKLTAKRLVWREPAINCSEFFIIVERNQLRKNIVFAFAYILICSYANKNDVL